MQGLHLKLIFANDPDMFQERLNRFIQGLPEDAMVQSVQYSTASTPSQVTYSALVQYKAIEEWVD